MEAIHAMNRSRDWVEQSLPRRGSAVSLHDRHESGRRDSNPRPPPWQGGSPPTEILPHGEQARRMTSVLQPRCQHERPRSSVCLSPTACGLVVHKRRRPTPRQSKTMQSWKTSVATCPLLAQRRQCLCVPPLGLEPRTHDLRGRCYYQLSYRGKAYERLVGLAGVEPAISSASWKRSAS